MATISCPSRIHLIIGIPYRPKDSTRLVIRFNLFVLEVIKAWTDPAQKHPKTIHHHGYGKFCVDGEMIKLKSRMP